MFVLAPPRMAHARLLLAAATLALGALALSVSPGRQRDATEAAAVQTDGRRAQFSGPYPARVLRVVDGDTFSAKVTVWFGQDIETLVRLRGVDAPERAARCGAEADGAERARQALAELLAAGRVSLVNVSGDKYFGRVVAEAVVESPDQSFPPTEVGPALLAQGMARRYDGRARASWCGLRAAR